MYSLDFVLAKLIVVKKIVGQKAAALRDGVVGELRDVTQLYYSPGMTE